MIGRGGGQPVVMREDDDLAVGRDLLENECEAVDLGRVHRLDRVIDDQEPERLVVVPRQENTQRQRVDLALAHGAERGARRPVDGDI